MIFSFFLNENRDRGSPLGVLMVATLHKVNSLDSKLFARRVFEIGAVFAAQRLTWLGLAGLGWAWLDLAGLG